MLVNYKHNNKNYSFLVKHIFNTTKSIMFVITKNELISNKILEEMLTLYLLKTDLKENVNLVVLYRNKYYSNIHDLSKIKLLHFKYNTRVIIKTETNADQYIKQLFKTRIDFSYTMILNFDQQDYEVLSLKYKTERDNRNNKIYNNFKKKAIFKKIKESFQTKLNNIIH